MLSRAVSRRRTVWMLKHAGGTLVSNVKGLLVLSADAVLTGAVRNCQRIEIDGYMEGEIAAQHVVVRPGGRFYGRLRSVTAEVDGELQGTAHVRDLIRIGESGSVTGDVHYGNVAMAAGGTLSATMHNVPPAVFGDLEMTVARGKSVAIDIRDLTAVDPDDPAHALTFTVSAVRGGFLALVDAPQTPVTTFTQADLEARRVVFTHDGANAAATASFDVVVTDAAGARSGAPQTVNVTVAG